jgi:hypothetical protein
VKTAILTSAFFLLLQSVASANTLSYTATIPTQTTDYTQSVSLQQFNSSLGTLNSVTVQLDGDFTITSLTFTNNAATTQTFTASSGIKFGLSGVGIAFNTGATLGVDVNNGASIVLAAGATSVDYAQPLGTLANSGSKSGSVLPANFAAYQGNGTVAFNFGTQTTTTFFGGGGNIQFNQTTVAGGAVKITYNYTAVPEPLPVFSGLVVVGFALVGRRYGQAELADS